MSRLLDLVLPRLCVGCGVPGGELCDVCRVNKLTYYYEHLCHVCRVPVKSGFVHNGCRQYTYLDGVVVSAIYDDFIKDLISGAKYRFRYGYLSPLSEIMHLKGLENRLFSGQVLSCVPLSKFKHRWRGFNQAALLGKLIARHSGLTYRELLVRKHDTETQVGKGRETRLENLAGAFEVRPKVVVPEGVIIVDDVMTTGSTIENCAAVLRSNGAKSVHGLVFARGG